MSDRFSNRGRLFDQAQSSKEKSIFFDNIQIEELTYLYQSTRDDLVKEEEKVKHL